MGKIYQQSPPFQPDPEERVRKCRPDGRKNLDKAKIKSGGMSSVETVCSNAAFEMRSLAPSFGTGLLFFFTRNLFTNLGRYKYIHVPRSKSRKRIGTYKQLYWSAARAEDCFGRITLA